MRLGGMSEAHALTPTLSQRERECPASLGGPSAFSPLTRSGGGNAEYSLSPWETVGVRATADAPTRHPKNDAA